VELRLRLIAGVNGVVECAAILLREAKQEITTSSHGVQPAGIELHGRPVLLEVTRERLDRVVRGVVRLLKSAKRRIDSLNGGEWARDGAQLLQRRVFVTIERGGDRGREPSQLVGVLESPRLVLELHVFAGDQRGLADLADNVSQIIR